MNARRVSAAAGVVFAAMKTRQTATGIAAALESARMLQSPETAAEQLAQLRELDALRLRVTELEAELRIGAPWDCHVCSKRNTRNACVICETYRPEPVNEAAAPVEDPHDSPLHHTYALGRDLPAGGAL